MDEDEEASALFLESSRFWIQRVFVPILVIIGVVGNFITVMILTRRRMRCTTHIYLTALAVADLIYLLLVLILSFEHYPNIHQRRYELYWRFYGITHWLCDAASSSSVWLTVSFTIERYIIVCHPLRGKIYCTESRAKNIITIVGLLCLMTTASTTFEHQLTWKEHCDEKFTPNTTSSSCNATLLQEENPCDNTTTCLVLNETCCRKSYTIYTEPTELGKNSTYTSIFYWFSSIVFGLLPLVLIATFNCFLVKAVFRSTVMRKAMTNSVEYSKQRHENRITILLIGIVVLFLICQTPTASFLIYDALDGDSSRTTMNIKRSLGNVFNFLLTLNASCNFLMYCVLSDNYRRTFKAVFCARKMRRHEVTMSRCSTVAPRNGFRRNRSEYRTPRTLECSSLTSIPRSKSLMTRPMGKARSTDLNV